MTTTERPSPATGTTRRERAGSVSVETTDAFGRFLFWLAIASSAAALVAVAVAVLWPTDFRTKAGIFVFLIGTAVAVAGLRSRHEGMTYFLAGERNEDEKICVSDDDYSVVRQISWGHRAGRASTYSSISLGIILVAAVLLAKDRADMDVVHRTLFTWVLLIAAVSVVLYGISLQLWDEALGEGYDRSSTLQLRTNALVLSSLGWMALMMALGLAVIVVDTTLGGVVGAVGVAAALFIFEHKWLLAYNTRHRAQPLESGLVPYLGRLRAGRPVLLAAPTTGSDR